MYGFVNNSPMGNIDPLGLDVYVVARNLTILQPDDVALYKNVIDFLEWVNALSSDKASDLKTVLEWYGKKTWHCTVVVLDCNDKRKKLKKLKKSNIREWSKINANNTRDYNNKGVNKPAADWRAPFAAENYNYRVKITRLTRNHKYDKAVLNAFTQNVKSGSAYDMGGANRYNCCDWAAETVGMAGLTYKNPNPKPFGDKFHFKLWLMSVWSGVDIASEIGGVLIQPFSR